MTFWGTAAHFSGIFQVSALHFCQAIFTASKFCFSPKYNFTMTALQCFRFGTQKEKAATAFDARLRLFQVVETAGIEPASEGQVSQTSTCLVHRLFLTTNWLNEQTRIIASPVFLTRFLQTRKRASRRCRRFPEPWRRQIEETGYLFLGSHCV